MAAVNDAMNRDSSCSAILLLPGQKHTYFWPSDTANPHGNVAGGVVCLPGAVPPTSLALCYPVRRWCHSWGEAMIKILLSLPRHSLTLHRDSLPPVQARRIVAVHLSSCLHSTGGRRVGHAPSSSLDTWHLSWEEEIKEQTLEEPPGSMCNYKRYWWRWWTLKHEECVVWFAEASGGTGTDPITQKQAILREN